MKAEPVSHCCGILVVDDDQNLATTLQEFLEHEGYPVQVALSGPEALALLDRDPQITIALVDLMMPGMDGLALAEQIHRRNADLAIIIMTGYGTIETAVAAIKSGAEDYVTKPFDHNAIRKKVARLMEVFELRERLAQLEAKLESYPSFENFIWVSPLVQRMVERARTAAATDVSILVLGESGTGKEMLARAIHAASLRSRGPFIAVNCGALPRELVESELFGFRRGAFTGAHSDTPGLFSAAAGGTVFLDEIGEMPKEVQVKLLRILQGGELRPVGSTKPVQVDVRVLAATNCPLAQLRGGVLREDLYFRIARVVVEVPPLRSRPEDILVLAQHFAARISRRCGRRIGFSRSAVELLLGYAFPGNVRELENLIESAAAVSTINPQNITDRDLKPLLQQSARIPEVIGGPSLSMEQAERLAIQRALRLSNGNRTKTASLLGISRDTLYRKLRQFNGNS